MVRVVGRVKEKIGFLQSGRNRTLAMWVFASDGSVNALLLLSARVPSGMCPGSDSCSLDCGYTPIQKPLSKCVVAGVDVGVIMNLLSGATHRYQKSGHQRAMSS